MPTNYKKDKDVFIQRRTSNNTRFEEAPLIVSPNSVVGVDASNNLTTIPLSSFAQGSSSLSSSVSDTASISITSSYSNTASYALNSPTGIVNGSSSFASSSISASYADTSSITVFNGDRSIKRSPFTGINVGGEDVVTFLNNLFFPFISATISLSGGTTYYQIGTTVNFSLTPVIVANDETIFGTASIRKDGVNTIDDRAVPPYTYVVTDTGITSNHSYVAYAQVDDNGSPTVISSGTRTAAFIYPYLWGMSTTAGLSGSALYDEFTKQVVASGNKTVSLVGNVVFIYFAYPASYPALSSILDPNSFEVIGNFQYSSSVPVTSTGLDSNWTTNYRVYRTTLVSDPNGNYQFRQ